MSIGYKHTLVAVIGTACVLSVFAGEVGHRSCEGKTMVSVGEMGIVNEELLQQHIDKVKEQMRRIRYLSGPQVDLRKREMKRHLSEMQMAMQQLHNLMYVGGCGDALHGASTDVRLQVVEKRLDAMQQMMEQMIDHISEQEK